MEEPGSDQAWFHDVLVRIRAALVAGDQAEVDRLKAYVRAEGGEGVRFLLDQALEATAAAAAGDRRARMVGLNLPGQRLCDFCGAPDPVAYYPVVEFELAGPTGMFRSGDRFYACTRCRMLVDAGDWRGLRDWVGPTAQLDGVRQLWFGFKRYRTGPAVDFEPGTDPEAGRQ